MVIDQGTLLDRIDYNIENMARDMEGAVEELKTATKCVCGQSAQIYRAPLSTDDVASLTLCPSVLSGRYQRRSGKRQVICLLILLIIGAVIILVYKPRARGQHHSDPPAVSMPPSVQPGLLEAGPLLLRRWRS